MTVQKRIAEVVRTHREELNEEGVCICGWHADRETDYPAHVAAAVQDALEVWLPPLFASAIHAYADGELTAYGPYDFEDTGGPALVKLNNEAASIASYALTSSKWRTT